MDNVSDHPDLLHRPPQASFGYRLWMLRHAWTRTMEAAMASTGLTHMQFFVLRATAFVRQTEGAPTQTRLAEALVVDRMTVSKVLRTLEARSLIVRAPHPEDPRANSVGLTPAGNALVQRAAELVFAEQERFFGRLGPDGKTAFSDMLDILLMQDESNQEPGYGRVPAMQECE